MCLFLYFNTFLLHCQDLVVYAHDLNVTFSLSQACFCKAGRMAWEAKDALEYALPAGLRTGADPSRLLAEASTCWEPAAHSSRAARIANQDLISWCSFPTLWKTCCIRTAWAWALVPFHAIGLAFVEVLTKLEVHSRIWRAQSMWIWWVLITTWKNSFSFLLKFRASFLYCHFSFSSVSSELLTSSIHILTEVRIVIKWYIHLLFIQTV